MLTYQNLRRCGFLPNERISNPNPAESSEAEASNKIDMASGVPSFVNKSASYDDLFGDEEKDTVPIEATPISRMKSTTASQDKSTTSSKRKLPPEVATDSVKAPGSRLSKKSKPSTPGTPGEGSNSLFRKFFAMAGSQISEEVIAEWDKMSFSEAAKATTWCEAQSLFHTLKRNEEMVVAACGDQKLLEEVRQLKSLLKTSEDEKKKLADASKKLKASEAKLLKERDQLNTSIINLDAEKDALKASYTKKVGDFKKKLDSLNTTIALERSTREAAKREKFEAGYSRGVNDYIESTYDHFPSLDWTLLGDDAVKMVDELKKKEVEAAADHEKVVQSEPEGEAQGADGTSLEVQMEDLEKADPAPDQDVPDVFPDNPVP
ncbi:hypothetical protein POM88_011094 [Heracleum sosnowskyi]|uniref:Uncharacterized protein n=1 Tax=Heracleum sosnowskyi TaxID=360622 RepID=A0AAD8IW85_9APIA|nr:hypothetical protein POM88_011094 [Heracleum sosnowskyi]